MRINKALDRKSLQRIKEINIQKCILLYQSFPAANKVWLALKTGMPFKFIDDNWDKITKK